MCQDNKELASNQYTNLKGYLESLFLTNWKKLSWTGLFKNEQ